LLCYVSFEYPNFEFSTNLKSMILSPANKAFNSYNLSNGLSNNIRQSKILLKFQVHYR